MEMGVLNDKLGRFRRLVALKFLGVVVEISWPRNRWTIEVHFVRILMAMY